MKRNGLNGITVEDIGLKQAVEEFAHIFDNVMKKETKNKDIILGISGGLDSRTIAASLKNSTENINSYSYYFKNSHREDYYSKKIAETYEAISKLGNSASYGEN